MRNLMQRIILQMVMLLSVASFGYAGTETSLRYRDMAVDKESVWVATSEGLVKFNKQTGTSGNYSSEGYDDFVAVTVSPSGDVAVGVKKSKTVAAFDGEAFHEIPIISPALSDIMCMDYDAGLWVGAYGNLKRKLDEKLTIWDTPYSESYAAYYIFYDMAYDLHTGYMWFGVNSSGTGSKLGYINAYGRVSFIGNYFVMDKYEKDGETVEFKYSPNVKELYVDPHGKVYVASERGMYVCENEEAEPLEYSINGLPAQCNTVTGDGESVWFSAGKMMVQYCGNQYSSFACNMSANPDDYIVKLSSDGDKVWVLMAYGGLFEFKDGKFSEPTPGPLGTAVTPVEPEVEPFVRTSVYRDMAVDNACVWLASANGLVKYDKQLNCGDVYNTDTYTNLSAVAISPDGVVTVGGFGNAGVATFDGGKFEPVVTGVEELLDVTSLVYSDGLWVGSEHQLQYKNSYLWNAFDNPDPCAAYYEINCMAYDKKRLQMWFGASSARPGARIGYARKNGEPDVVTMSYPDVYDICFTSSGVMYTATEYGLITDASDNDLHYVFKHEVSGLPTECYAVTGDDDTIWYAGEKILVRSTKDDCRTFECELSDYPDDCIVKLAVDGDRLWVLMSKAGLFEFNDNEFHKVNLDKAGLEGVWSDANPVSRMYDLFGRAITSPAKGQIYIQNGKKYIGR